MAHDLGNACIPAVRTHICIRSPHHTGPSTPDKA